MTRAQIAAVFLAGTTAGVTGKSVVEGLTSSAIAATVHPTAHAVDLRRRYDGSQFSYAVYGSRAQPDGGYVDLSAAKKCAPTAEQLKALNVCMFVAGQSCEW